MTQVRFIWRHLILLHQLLNAEDHRLENEGQAGDGSPDSLHVKSEGEQLRTEEINHGQSDGKANGVNESE